MGKKNKKKNFRPRQQDPSSDDDYDDEENTAEFIYVQTQTSASRGTGTGQSAQGFWVLHDIDVFLDRVAKYLVSAFRTTFLNLVPTREEREREREKQDQKSSTWGRRAEGGQSYSADSSSSGYSGQQQQQQQSQDHTSNSPKKSHWELLGLQDVPPTERSPELISKTFRKLSLEHHLDKDPSPGAKERFQRLVAARDAALAELDTSEATDGPFFEEDSIPDPNDKKEQRKRAQEKAKAQEKARKDYRAEEDRIKREEARVRAHLAQQRKYNYNLARKERAIAEERELQVNRALRKGKEPPDFKLSITEQAEQTMYALAQQLWMPLTLLPTNSPLLVAFELTSPSPFFMALDWSK